MRDVIEIVSMRKATDHPELGPRPLIIRASRRGEEPSPGIRSGLRSREGLCAVLVEYCRHASQDLSTRTGEIKVDA